METFETFFLDGFPLDEISRSCIDGDGHISAASPISIFTRTLLTVVSKIIKRLSYYCKHVWWPELLYTFSAAYNLGCLQAEGPKIIRSPLQCGALSDLKLGRPASHVRNGVCKSHWTPIKLKKVLHNVKMPNFAAALESGMDGSPWDADPDTTRKKHTLQISFGYLLKTKTQTWLSFLKNYCRILDQQVLDSSFQLIVWITRPNLNPILYLASSIPTLTNVGEFLSYPLRQIKYICT